MTKSRTRRSTDASDARILHLRHTLLTLSDETLLSTWQTALIICPEKPNRAYVYAQARAGRLLPLKVGRQNWYKAGAVRRFHYGRRESDD